MSKITLEKSMRKFDWDKDAPVLVRQTVITPATYKENGKLKKQARGNWIFKEMKGAMVKREEIQPALPRKEMGLCFRCKNPVYVSVGQIINIMHDRKGNKIFSHRSCRKEWGY